VNEALRSSPSRFLLVFAKHPHPLIVRAAVVVERVAIFTGVSNRNLREDGNDVNALPET
jgi:hypothetical protein